MRNSNYSYDVFWPEGIQYQTTQEDGPAVQAAPPAKRRPTVQQHDESHAQSFAAESPVLFQSLGDLVPVRTMPVTNMNVSIRFTEYE